MHLMISKYTSSKGVAYPGFMYNSTTYNDEYDKYRVNEIIKM